MANNDIKEKVKLSRLLAKVANSESFYELSPNEQYRFRQLGKLSKYDEIPNEWKKFIERAI